MRAILWAAAGLAILCGAAAAEERRVPAVEVLSWAENDTIWCMNPSRTGGCDGLMALWRPVRGGGFEFVAAEVLDAAGSLFTVTQPFTVEGDRQCYTVDPATIRFGSIGKAAGPALQDAKRRWLIGLRNEAGKRFCMAFWRDRTTGLVRRQQWVDGVERANVVDEVWRVTFLGSGT